MDDLANKSTTVYYKITLPLSEVDRYFLEDFSSIFQYSVKRKVQFNTIMHLMFYHCHSAYCTAYFSAT